MKIQWLTRTAILTALLLTLQIITKPLGQIVTGSLVNMVLLISVLNVGLLSGIAVGALSPIFAFLLGVTPIAPVVPFIIVGNIVLVLAAHYVPTMLSKLDKPVATVAGIVCAAVLKYLFLFLVLVKIALPVLSGLKPPQVAALSVSFSWMQLVTALLGGLLALIISPFLERALSKRA